ncbi:uncharacterized protein [Dermacentor andersoni]|uniref:uncharacterized protein isoform X1 n=2 Tax=Dermacentor andersoni TaxID=34620 RepID=UPI002155A86C|nr:uncharacterized protein LOC126544239 isoform X1 [Dermacentor andersoni]
MLQTRYRFGPTQEPVREGRSAMARPVWILSCRHLLLATVVTLFAAAGIVGACHDLDFFRTRQECSHTFENEFRRSYDEYHHDHDKSREIVCCALMRANQCIKSLYQRKQCQNDGIEILAHFARKASTKDCENFDYRPCGSGTSTIGASALLLAALVAFVVKGSS